MTPLAFYALLFVAVGAGFVFVHLMAGKLIRPSTPDAEKGTIYECGEPTIGTAWVQFDLRYYVVALLFVIFDVEVAFFFPWAVVFGSANRAADTSLPAEQRLEAAANLTPPGPGPAAVVDPAAMHDLAGLAFGELMVFFGILLVGFAYLWKRGDLEWVRSVSAEKLAASGLEPLPSMEEESLVGAGKE